MPPPKCEAAPTLGEVETATANNTADANQTDTASVADAVERRELLIALAAVRVETHAGPATAGLMLAHALTYAANGWEVFPLRRKAPAIRSPHPKGYRCDLSCGLEGHGLLDATTDLATICRWWAVEYRGANIAARVPASVVVIDSDPRKDGHNEAMATLVAKHGPLPRTLATLSGRLDGGCHRFFRHPGGHLTPKPMGPGFDIRDRGGYVVMPPSLHPATGRPYIAVDAPIVDAPEWMVEMMRRKPAVKAAAPRSASERFFASSGITYRPGQSPADTFSENTSWAQILEPHGWVCLDADPDSDGARWLHPAATSSCSATVRHGLLFAYTTSTVFEPTASGDANGYTRFRAHAVLNFGGDMSAAARSLKGVA